MGFQGGGGKGLGLKGWGFAEGVGVVWGSRFRSSRSSGRAEVGGRVLGFRV